MLSQVYIPTSTMLKSRTACLDSRPSHSPSFLLPPGLVEYLLDSNRALHKQPSASSKTHQSGLEILTEHQSSVPVLDAVGEIDTLSLAKASVRALQIGFELRSTVAVGERDIPCRS